MSTLHIARVSLLMSDYPATHLPPLLLLKTGISAACRTDNPTCKLFNA